MGRVSSGQAGYGVKLAISKGDMRGSGGQIVAMFQVAMQASGS